MRNLPSGQKMTSGQSRVFSKADSTRSRKVQETGNNIGKQNTPGSSYRKLNEPIWFEIEPRTRTQSPERIVLVLIT